MITAQKAKKMLAKAREQVKGDPNIIGVSIGYKYKRGRRTEKVGIIYSVRVKKPINQLSPQQVLPKSIEGVSTDVKERGEYIALNLKGQALTSRKRPCPPGFSIGHPSITAGTLGAWVHDVSNNDDFFILSNNHVVADSNAASPGDNCLQPGPADGGNFGDQIGTLTKFVRIHLTGGIGNGGGKKKNNLAKFYWGVMRGTANGLARIFTADQCKYRLGTPQEVGVIEQPNPNLVDTGLVGGINPEDVNLDTPYIGELQGFTELELGDEVEKTGRTTSHTLGFVEEIFATALVNYGEDGSGDFEDQIVVRGNTGNFSAGGDSGSVIYKRGTGLAGGLLFAGGGGVTIGNRISNVVALLGIRV